MNRLRQKFGTKECFIKFKRIKSTQGVVTCVLFIDSPTRKKDCIIVSTTLHQADNAMVKVYDTTIFCI